MTSIYGDKGAHCLSCRTRLPDDGSVRECRMKRSGYYCSNSSVDNYAVVCSGCAIVTCVNLSRTNKSGNRSYCAHCTELVVLDEMTYCCDKYSLEDPRRNCKHIVFPESATSEPTYCLPCVYHSMVEEYSQLEGCISTVVEIRKAIRSGERVAVGTIDSDKYALFIEKSFRQMFDKHCKYLLFKELIENFKKFQRVF